MGQAGGLLSVEYGLGAWSVTMGEEKVLGSEHSMVGAWSIMVKI